MAEMDESDYADMVEQTPVRTYVLEYREPSKDGKPGQLVGACLTDQQGDGLSMIYSFSTRNRTRARASAPSSSSTTSSARAAGLPYVYLGYWVEGSARMAYKTRYRPLERLGRDGWRRMDEAPIWACPTSESFQPGARAIDRQWKPMRSRQLHPGQALSERNYVLPWGQAPPIMR